MIQYVSKQDAAGEEWDQRYCEADVMVPGGIPKLEAAAIERATVSFPAEEGDCFIVPDYKILPMGPKISRATIKVYRRK
jgi:hypothetical protein